MTTKTDRIDFLLALLKDSQFWFYWDLLHDPFFWELVDDQADEKEPEELEH